MNDPNHTSSPKVVLCAQDNCELFQTEVREVLVALNMTSALVTDESTLGDFMMFFDKNSPAAIAHNEEILNSVQSLVGHPVKENDFIWEIARDLCNKKDKVSEQTKH